MSDRLRGDSVSARLRPQSINTATAAYSPHGVLRQSLLSKEREPGDLGRSLSLLILFVLISIWVHLMAFIIWQTLDGEAADAFYFELAGTSAPAMELTLTFNEPEDESIITAEAPPEPETAISDEPEETAPQMPADEAALLALAESAMTAGPLDLDEALTRSELLPAVSDEPRETANPDPPIQVEGEAPELKSYYTAIRRAVNRGWIMPPAARTQFRPGRLTVDFTVSRDGALLRFVVIESTGNPILDHAAQEALRSAAPFPPFPEELTKFSQLDIRMHFDYQAKYMPSKQ